MGELTIAFNELLKRLEISFNSQKQFVSNVSHELRTPRLVDDDFMDDFFDEGIFFGDDIRFITAVQDPVSFWRSVVVLSALMTATCPLYSGSGTVTEIHSFGCSRLICIWMKLHHICTRTLSNENDFVPVSCLLINTLHVFI